MSIVHSYQDVVAEMKMKMVVVGAKLRAGRSPCHGLVHPPTTAAPEQGKVFVDSSAFRILCDTCQQELVMPCYKAVQVAKLWAFTCQWCLLVISPYFFKFKFNVMLPPRKKTFYDRSLREAWIAQNR